MNGAEPTSPLLHLKLFQERNPFLWILICVCPKSHLWLIEVESKSGIWKKIPSLSSENEKKQGIQYANPCCKDEIRSESCCASDLHSSSPRARQRSADHCPWVLPGVHSGEQHSFKGRCGGLPSQWHILHDKHDLQRIEKSFGNTSGQRWITSWDSNVPSSETPTVTCIKRTSHFPLVFELRHSHSDGS